MGMAPKHAEHIKAQLQGCKVHIWVVQCNLNTAEDAQDTLRKGFVGFVQVLLGPLTDLGEGHGETCCKHQAMEQLWVNVGAKHGLMWAAKQCCMPSAVLRCSIRLHMLLCEIS